MATKPRTTSTKSRARAAAAAAPSPQAAWQAAYSAVEEKIDPIGMATPLLHAQLAWLSHPQELAVALSGLGTKMAELQLHSWRRMMGLPSQDVESPHPDDTRFSESVWQDVAGWDILKEWYLLLTHQAQDMLYATPGLSSRDRRRAAFWWRKWLNAAAPTNFLATNPVAMRKAIETRGESLLRGLNNWLADVRAGDVQMTRREDFVVGKNLATTPGEVVFRNHLLEVIRYAPSQPKVHARPVVVVTAWINKFYILDLTPKRSLVKFLVDQGFDVYITSWKNPPAEMRDITFDDYLVDGIECIVRTALEISGADKVNAVGYCIGGAALATYLAWANRHYAEDKVPVAAATFLTTLVDYHRPGDIEVFIDEATVKWLEKTMAERGYLDGKQMAASFRLLRSNSLIWNYVVNSYLMGDAPPPFDVLYWNMDATRMPAAMHSWYLRNFYLENNLMRRDVLTVAGQPIDLGRIVQPVYAVGAEDDHIAPWRQTFRLMNVVSGERRYALSSSGHILGIVNPIVNPPKREYRVGNPDRAATAEEWREQAGRHAGSWWEDWMAWFKPLAGPLQAPGDAAAAGHPSLGPAPGTYVLET